ncbi:MAG: Holliday junction resolvase RuvX [Planctomycetota bacterium]|nr:Holliday junction resolvase RuvX [Planctomycetota bacterium]MDA1179023.1 Holliday junction resolvase RuvX [Planctomycetota bacterium]
MTDSVFERSEGRLAGVDFGTVRIGISITDRERRWVSPLTVYRRRDSRADADFFRTLVHAEQVVGLVVGLPVHLNGQESQKSVEARRFGLWLTERTQTPVVFFDERFTSREAEELLRERGHMARKKKQDRLDAVAAQVLLQAYLESVARVRHEGADGGSAMGDGGGSLDGV